MLDKFAAALNLRGAKKALAAVLDCQDRIAAAQDVDAPAVRRQSSAPVPANHPGYWVTFQDYPQEAMRAHMQGIAKFRLTIDRKGLVDTCHITSTSGYTLLDEETCKLLKARARSEEHTSELQSLMRISYAVFCLKKKNLQITT